MVMTKLGSAELILRMAIGPTMDFARMGFSYLKSAVDRFKSRSQTKASERTNFLQNPTLIRKNVGSVAYTKGDFSLNMCCLLDLM